MKTVGMILAILVILVLVIIIFYMGRLIRIARKSGNAYDVRAERKNNGSVRAEADRRRIEDIMDQEDEKAAQLNSIIAEHVTEFTLDWSYRKAEHGLGLDGVHDKTGVNWIMLLPGKDLALAVEQYIAVKQYIKEMGTSYRAHGAVMWRKDITHLRVSSRDEIESLKGIKEDVFDRCRENGIRILIETEENCYYDLVDQYEYEVYVGSTWPGSADDAATYGTLELVKK